MLPLAMPALTPFASSSALRSLALEVLGDQRIVGLGGRLDQLLAGLVGRALQVVRDSVFFTLLADVGLLREHVDDALERGLASRSAAEPGCTSRPNVAWICWTVRSKSAFSRSIRLMKMARGSSSSSAKRQANSVPTWTPPTASTVIKRRLDGAEAALHLAHEVHVAGRVDDVDLVVFPLEGEQRDVQAELALMLVGVPVADGRAVLDLAHAGRGAGGEQHRLGQRCLAGAAVAGQSDVTNLIGRVVLHNRYPLLLRVFAILTLRT